MNKETSKQLSNYYSSLFEEVNSKKGYVDVATAILNIMKCFCSYDLEKMNDELKNNQEKYVSPLFSAMKLNSSKSKQLIISIIQLYIESNNLSTVCSFFISSRTY